MKSASSVSFALSAGRAEVSCSFQPVQCKSVDEAYAPLVSDGFVSLVSIKYLLRLCVIRGLWRV